MLINEAVTPALHCEKGVSAINAGILRHLRSPHTLRNKGHYRWRVFLTGQPIANAGQNRRVAY